MSKLIAGTAKVRKRRKKPRGVSINNLLNTRTCGGRYGVELAEEAMLRARDSCRNNPNFAIVCDFILKFSEICRLPVIPMTDLQNMLEEEVPGGAGPEYPHPDLKQLHMVLLRRIPLAKPLVVTRYNWERALLDYCRGEGILKNEAKLLESEGYSKLTVAIRLEILRHLMESQFLYNEALKLEADLLPTEELRLEPSGLDVEGLVYWSQVGESGDIRVYQEDPVYGEWDTLVQSRDELVILLEQLKKNSLYAENLGTKEHVLETKEQSRPVEDPEAVPLQLQAAEVVKPDLEAKEQSPSLEVGKSQLVANSDPKATEDLKLNENAMKVMKSLSEPLEVVKNDLEETSGVKLESGDKEAQAEAGTGTVKKQLGCQLCSLVCRTRLQLLEHYSGHHFTKELAAQFSDQVEALACKLCSFDAAGSESAELLIWTHMGTMHESVNVILRQMGLLPVPLKKVQVQVPVPLTEIASCAAAGAPERAQKSNHAVTALHGLRVGLPTTERTLTRQSKSRADLSKMSCEKGRLVETLTAQKRREKAGGSATKAQMPATRRQSSRHRFNPFVLLENIQVELEDEEDQAPSAAAAAEDESDLFLTDDPDNLCRFVCGICNKISKWLRNHVASCHKLSVDVYRQLHPEYRYELKSHHRCRLCGKILLFTIDAMHGHLQTHKISWKEYKMTYLTGEVEKYGENGNTNLPVMEMPLQPKIAGAVLRDKGSGGRCRRESKIPCTSCYSRKECGTDIIQKCPACRSGWHINCIRPPLAARAGSDWSCPLCQHKRLVEMLEVVLAELDYMTERAHNRRLAALKENRSASAQALEDEQNQVQEEEKEREDATHSETGPTPKQRRPNYREFSSSDEMELNEAEEEEEGWQSVRTVCTCQSSGRCLRCRRLRGCTCEGAGTCRLCQSEGNIGGEELLRPQGNKYGDCIIISDEECREESALTTKSMSTSELFLLTGQSRTPKGKPRSVRGSRSAKTATGPPNSRPVGTFVGLKFRQSNTAPPSLMPVNSRVRTIERTFTVRTSGEWEPHNPLNAIKQKILPELEAVEHADRSASAQPLAGQRWSQAELPSAEINPSVDRQKTELARKPATKNDNAGCNAGNHFALDQSDYNPAEKYGQEKFLGKVSAQQVDKRFEGASVWPSGPAKKSAVGQVAVPYSRDSATAISDQPFSTRISPRGRVSQLTSSMSQGGLPARETVGASVPRRGLHAQPGISPASRGISGGKPRISASGKEHFGTLAADTSTEFGRGHLYRSGTHEGGTSGQQHFSRASCQGGPLIRPRVSAHARGGKLMLPTAVPAAQDMHPALTQMEASPQGGYLNHRTGGEGGGGALGQQLSNCGTQRHAIGPALPTSPQGGYLPNQRRPGQSNVPSDAYLASGTFRSAARCGLLPGNAGVRRQNLPSLTNWKVANPIPRLASMTNTVSVTQASSWNQNRVSMPSTRGAASHSSTRFLNTSGSAPPRACSYLYSTESSTIDQDRTGFYEHWEEDEVQEVEEAQVVEQLQEEQDDVQEIDFEAEDVASYAYRPDSCQNYPDWREESVDESNIEIQSVQMGSMLPAGISSSGPDIDIVEDLEEVDSLHKDVGLSSTTATGRDTAVVSSTMNQEAGNLRCSSAPGQPVSVIDLEEEENIARLERLPAAILVQRLSEEDEEVIQLD